MQRPREKRRRGRGLCRHFNTCSAPLRTGKQLLEVHGTCKLRQRPHMVSTNSLSPRPGIRSSRKPAPARSALSRGLGANRAMHPRLSDATKRAGMIGRPDQMFWGWFERPSSQGVRRRRHLPVQKSARLPPIGDEMNFVKSTVFFRSKRSAT